MRVLVNVDPSSLEDTPSSLSALFTRNGKRHAWNTPMERMSSVVVLDPCAECGSVKFGTVLGLIMSNVMLLDALVVDETSERVAVDL